MDILRKIDAAGRVSVPKVIRDLIEIEPGAEVMFSVEGDKIILRKQEVEKSVELTLADKKAIAAEMLMKYGYGVPEELQ